MAKPSKSKILANPLKSIRGDLSQQVMADTVGVSRALWSAWENRTRTLTVPQLNLIQSQLELSDKKITQIRKWVGVSTEAFV